MIELVKPETGGDPQGCCQYTRSSLRSLAKRLGRGSATTIGRLLKPLGYSLKTNVKRLIGKIHPQRDWQYRLIQRTKALFIRAGQPVISVDVKKSELIGQFKNSGKRYCQTADEVNVSEFVVASIRHWWQQLGAGRYPKANHLLIEADAGGGNGY